jgi:sulfofructose kinase
MEPLAQTLDFACAAAALNCTGTGARGGIQPLASIERLIASGSRHATEFTALAANRDAAGKVKLKP